MPDYHPPIDDSKFVLFELIRSLQLAEYPAFQEYSEELADSVLEEAGRFAAEQFAPINDLGDKQGVRIEERAVIAAAGFREAYQQYQEAGWLGLAIPDEHGGQGLPFLLHMAVSEYWNSANLSMSICPMLSMGAIEALIAHADPALCETYLGPLVEGRWTGTMNLTEPQAGSDLAAVRTKAVPEGDAYRITGQKIYISWGDHDMTENILHLVLARLPDAPAGVHGLSLFLVPKFMPDSGERNDVYAISCEHKLGLHASPTCVMSFGETDGNGAVGYLVGEANKGLSCMFTMMNHARLEVGLEGVGLAERATQAAYQFAADRKQGQAAGVEGQAPINRHADVRRMLLTMRSLTEAGRALAMEAAAMLDHSHGTSDEAARKAYRQRLDLLTPVVKAWCTELAQEVTSLSIQVHGGMGYVEETGVAQFYRDARITPIYEGTNGIQSGDLIGRKFLRDGGVAMRALIDDIGATLAELQSHESVELQRYAESLEQALKAHQNTAAGIQSRFAEAPDGAGLAAFDFMMMTGLLLGGWFHARSLLVVQPRLGRNDVDDKFAKRKILSAGFYLERILPRVHGLARAVDANPNDVVEIDSAFL